MGEAQYRTGQAARLLNISAHHIRRLCEARIIEAELTAGKRWRIPAGEVERLKHDGIPPIPQISSAEPVTPCPPAATPEYAANRDSATSQSECGLPPQVQAEADGLAVAERRLKRRRLELEQEDVEDSFREREKRRRAEREAEQRAAAEESARLRRKRWLEIWVVFGLARLKQQFFPYTSVPGECSLGVHSEVERALRDLTPEHSEDMLILLVDACVRKIAAPYERRAEIQKAIDAAMAVLPYEARWSPQC
jgi:excisionase family DNA binding protein